MKPIIFNTAMVQAILDGRKTVTRRMIKIPDGLTGRPVGNSKEVYPINPIGFMHAGGIVRPKYIVDDILYVRETFCELGELDGNDQPIYKTLKYYYAADNPDFPFNRFLRENGTFEDYPAWKPSIHMPKEAARIFLKVTDVRVERLQDITDEGAKAEGVNFGVGWEEKMQSSAIDRFKTLWNSIYQNWNENPYVWVFDFERYTYVSKEGKHL